MTTESNNETKPEASAATAEDHATNPTTPGGEASPGREHNNVDMKVRGLRSSREDLQQKRRLGGVGVDPEAGGTRSNNTSNGSINVSSSSREAPADLVIRRSMIRDSTNTTEDALHAATAASLELEHAAGKKSLRRSQSSRWSSLFGSSLSLLELPARLNVGRHGLRKNTNRPRIDSSIGAVAVGSQDYGFDEFDLGIVATEEEDHDPEVLIPNSSCNLVMGDLVEATPINRTVAPRRLNRAREVDLEEMQRQRDLQERQEQQCRRIGLAIALVATLTLTIVLSVTLTTSGRQYKPTVQEAPTPLPSTLHSAMPTAAPSTALEAFQQTLPPYTLKSLQDVESPQRIALHWVSSLDNFANLEHWRKTQLFVLAMFYHSFSGPQWPHGLDKDWLDLDNGRTECDWHSHEFGYFDEDGVFQENDRRMFYIEEICNDKGEYLTLALESVDLSMFQLALPPEIELLTSLTSIRFFDCGINASLSEWIPSQLYWMTQLVELYLVGNSLTGQIPSDIGSLTNLEYLSLHHNALTGTIPIFLHSEMQSLGGVQFADNALSGSLPSELGSTVLWLLNVESNQLSGSIPSQLALLTNLDALLLHRNSFTGSLPSQLSLLTQMGWLSADHNALTGSVMSEFGSFYRLRILSLRGNFIQGSIPTQLGLMRGLRSLTLDNNLISGRIPSQLGFLSVRNHSEAPSGYIPLEHWALMNVFEGLSLGNNNLSGSLPSELGLLPGMGYLRTNQNPGLGGIVPPELGNCNLYHVDLSGTTLSGSIPSEVGMLVNSTLAYFNVSDTHLSGIVPEELCSLNDTLGFDCSQSLCGCYCVCE